MLLGFTLYCVLSTVNCFLYLVFTYTCLNFTIISSCITFSTLFSFQKAIVLIRLHCLLLFLTLLVLFYQVTFYFIISSILYVIIHQILSFTLVLFITLIFFCNKRQQWYFCRFIYFSKSFSNQFFIYLSFHGFKVWRFGSNKSCNMKHNLINCFDF